jgi:hypothetical protein
MQGVVVASVLSAPTECAMTFIGKFGNLIAHFDQA